MDYCIDKIPVFINNAIDLPASKSISNRVLVIDALSGRRCDVGNVARCDDTDAMIAALANDTSATVNIGAAGTAMRFLTAYFSVQEGRTVVLDGTERMRQRPIKPLVDALNACGADIRYVGQVGYPPIELHGRSYHCDSLAIDASMSSQFISAVLMVAPVIGCKRVTLMGKIISRPYIDMTLGIMRQFGIHSQWEGNTIVMDGVYVPPSRFIVESDWSAASYWFEIQALNPSLSHIFLRGLFADSLQGDSRVCDIFKRFGVEAVACDGGIELRHCKRSDNRCMELDMADCPDLAQTVVVTACLLEVPFHITGLQTLRIKETDRIEALRSQLLKLGYEITVGDDCSLSYGGEPSVYVETRMQNVVIETFDDHRMAMAFAPAALVHPGIVVADAGVVSKSYPDYWRHLAASGFGIKEV